MKKYYIQVIISLWLLTGAMSCEKFVDPGTPKDMLVTEKVFESNETANSAMLAVYLHMINEIPIPYWIPLFLGSTADEFRNYTEYADLRQVYVNNIYPNNDMMVSYLWNNIYNYIYMANSILEGLNASSSVSAQVKQQLMGEATFMRAFLHFYLVNIYGDVPLVTTTDYMNNSRLSRSSVEQVYDQVIKDLKEAQRILHPAYVDKDGTTAIDERVRPNKAAATALLARVYLYRRDWANAQAEATKLINDMANYQLPDPANAFLKNSTETIWALQPNANFGTPTPEGRYFTLTSAPDPGTFNCVAISSSLRNTFETGDKRETLWLGQFGTDTFAAKYKIYTEAPPVKEYSIVLRLAEQYLIRAEARTMLNDIDGAQDDLNEVRRRAGLRNTTASTQDTLLDAIMQERRVEFFVEWGHRWMDLNRTGKIDEVMEMATPLKGGIWKTEGKRYPIPHADRLNNPNLSQNPGYN